MQQKGKHDNLHLNALRHAIKNIRMLIIHLLFKQITIGNRYDLINNACSRSCLQSLKRYIHFIFLGKQSKYLVFFLELVIIHQDIIKINEIRLHPHNKSLS